MQTAVSKTNLSLLAQRIESDIRQRGLRPGDRYHTSSDVALMLGVSPATAHRAMNILVRRKLLAREHGRGTFVGTGIGPQRRVAVRTVYIFIEEHQRDLTGVPLETMVAAVRGDFPQTNVQFSFIPASSGVEYVRELVSVAQQAGHFAGAIPISCSREVYRFLADTGAPVVVLGSLYPDQWQLSSVDLDYRTSGHLMAEHLVKHGHRRIALFTTGGGRPGDNALYDGVSDALTAAGLSPNALVMRVFPQDFGAFHAQTVELLRHDTRPTGVICASDRLVGVVASCAEELKLSIPADIELVFQSQSVPAAGLLGYPYVQPKHSFREVAQLVAGMLRRVADRETPENRHIVIPVELRTASSTKQVLALQ